MRGNKGKTLLNAEQRGLYADSAEFFCNCQRVVCVCLRLRWRSYKAIS